MLGFVPQPSLRANTLLGTVKNNGVFHFVLPQFDTIWFNYAEKQFVFYLFAT
jgi:hypothetical protein